MSLAFIGFYTHYWILDTWICMLLSHFEQFQQNTRPNSWTIMTIWLTAHVPPMKCVVGMRINRGAWTAKITKLNSHCLFTGVKFYLPTIVTESQNEYRKIMKISDATSTDWTLYFQLPHVPSVSFNPGFCLALVSLHSAKIWGHKTLINFN